MTLANAVAVAVVVAIFLLINKIDRQSLRHHQ